jgi:hypothetical protein
MDPKLQTRSIARHLDTFAEHKVGAFTLHDLRRTVRTGLAKLGICPDIAGALPESCAARHHRDV